MTVYVVRRLLLGAGVVVGVSLVTFILAYLVPADPARVYAGSNATAQTVAHLPAGPGAGPELDRAAGGHRGVERGRLVRTPAALVDAGNARHRLRAHRPCQGAGRPRRGAAPCPAQRHHAHRDAGGTGYGLFS